MKDHTGLVRSCSFGCRPSPSTETPWDTRQGRGFLIVRDSDKDSSLSTRIPKHEAAKRAAPRLLGKDYTDKEKPQARRSGRIIFNNFPASPKRLRVIPVHVSGPGYR